MNRRSVALTTATVVIGVGFGAAVAVPAAADWYQHRSQAAVSSPVSPSDAGPGSGAGAGSGPAADAASADGKGAVRPAKAATRSSEGTGAFGFVVRSTGGDRILRVALPHHGATSSCRPAGRGDVWLRAHPGDHGTARPGGHGRTGHCGPYAAHPSHDSPYRHAPAGRH
jgi:hypothetical protein